MACTDCSKKIQAAHAQASSSLQYAQAWKRICASLADWNAGNITATRLLDELSELVIIYGDPNKAVPTGVLTND